MCKVYSPGYWYEPSPENTAAAVEFLLANRPEEYTVEREYDSDESLSAVTLDGWRVTASDDAVHAMRPGGTTREVERAEVPQRVLAVLDILAAYRASWWPGGENFERQVEVGDTVTPFGLIIRTVAIFRSLSIGEKP